MYIKIGWAKILTSSTAVVMRMGRLKKDKAVKAMSILENTNECGKMTKLEVSVLESSKKIIKIFKTYVCFTELRFVDVRL